MRTQENTTGITNIYNLIILDESGSMRSIYEQALGGANETIQTIRAAQASADDQKQFLTFVTFDSGDRESVRTVIDTKSIEHVKDLTRDDYRPNGCTPLYDAMGRSLTALEQKVTDDDQVLVTIITDGMENSSREYSGASVCEIVKRLRAKGWTFVYIGANQDAVEVARRMSIDNAMNFQATHEDTRRMWKDYRESTSGYYEKVRMSKMRGERIFEDKEFFAKGQESSRMTPDRITSYYQQMTLRKTSPQDKPIDGMRYTPENIRELKEGQVFVFGSNLGGAHGGGAAAAAVRYFGAIWGQGVGMQGQSYAIPTMHGGVEAIKPYVDEFIEYARQHQELTFLVTRIGCGIAGFKDEQMAPLFKDCLTLENVVLPKSFCDIIK